MRTLHILLVEDDPDDVDLLEAAFIGDRISVRMDTVIQGDAVLPHLTALQHLPDVIVLDVNLPRMHGREVLQLLKVSAPFQGIPVAILTTSSSTADREFCEQAGAEVFLTKPSTVEGFKAVTRAILGAAGEGRVDFQSILGLFFGKIGVLVESGIDPLVYAPTSLKAYWADADLVKSCTKTGSLPSISR